MITVFAIGMIVGTPAMAILTLRVPRRVTLSSALVVFAIGHVIVALSSNFGLILGARFLTAVATGAFWAVAAVVGAKAAGPASSSRALGIVLGGGMLANVIGVPLGALAGQSIGWRGPFWALAALALVAAAVVHRLVPADTDSGAVPSWRAEIASLRDGRIWLVLSGCAVVCGSSLAAYSFISPLLTENTGLAASAVPLVLVGYGLGAFVGSNLGGRLGAKHQYGVLFVSAAMTFLVLGALCLFSHNVIVTVILVVMLGLFGMSTNPILIGMAVRYADQRRRWLLLSAPRRSIWARRSAPGSPGLRSPRVSVHWAGVGRHRRCRSLLSAADDPVAQGTHEAHHRRSRQLTTRSTVAQFVSRPSATAPTREEQSPHSHWLPTRRVAASVPRTAIPALRCRS